MDWKFETVASPGYIRIVTGGIFSSDDFLRLFNELFALSDWKLGTPLLLEHRNLNVSDVMSAELIRAADNVVGLNGKLAFTRVSILYDEAHAMEMGERFGRIVEPRSSARIKRFLSEKLALDWIAPGRE